MRYLLTLLLITSSLLALPVGNPADPKLYQQGFLSKCDLEGWPLKWCDNFSFRAGYYQDVVIQRNLEKPWKCEENEDTLESSMRTYAAYLALNYRQRFDLFVKLGSTNYSYSGSAFMFQLPSANFTYTNHLLDVQMSYGFSWGIGGQLILLDCGPLTVSAEGEYQHSRNEISYLTCSGVSAPFGVVHGSAGQIANYYEWQASLGASYQIYWMVPYAAVKWAGAYIDQGKPLYPFDAQNPVGVVVRLSDLLSSKTWGFALGLSLVDCSVGSLTIESRFADEIGYYLNAQFRF